LEEDLLNEIISTFQNFADTDFDDKEDDDLSTQISTLQITQQQQQQTARVHTKDQQVLDAMMLAMGCDITPEKARMLYQRYKDPSTAEDVLSLTLI